MIIVVRSGLSVVPSVVGESRIRFVFCKNNKLNNSMAKWRERGRFEIPSDQDEF